MSDSYFIRWYKVCEYFGLKPNSTEADQFLVRIGERSELSKFLIFLGHGCNTRGKFPTNLSELLDDVRSFQAQASEDEDGADV